jgi:hypothetical protein
MCNGSHVVHQSESDGFPFEAEQRKAALAKPEDPGSETELAPHIDSLVNRSNVLTSGHKARTCSTGIGSVC